MSHINHPSSVIWNDLDLYDNYRDFTTDPATFPAEEVRNFISALVRFSERVRGAKLICPFRTRLGNTVCNFVNLMEDATHP